MKRICAMFLIIALLLSGCAVVEQITLPEDGNPNDVTCKGSYLPGKNEPWAPDTVVARAGDGVLTNEGLQVWYHSVVAAYRSSGAEVQPDYEARLDAQPCPIDSTVNSWQQYFLRQALDTWHAARVMVDRSQALGVSEYTEDAFVANMELWDINLIDIPAVKYLYRYGEVMGEPYTPNTKHMAYLESLPELIADAAAAGGYADGEDYARQVFGVSLQALTEAAEMLNFGYMYFTDLSYYENDALEDPAEQEGDTKLVNIRHMLIQPELYKPWKDATLSVDEDGTVTADERLWERSRRQMNSLLAACRYDVMFDMNTAFALKAIDRSIDTDSAAKGGAYFGLKPGQLLPDLEKWCFDEARKPGDYTSIRTRYGFHLLYFVGTESEETEGRRQALLAERQLALLEEAKAEYPMTISYGDIQLQDALGTESVAQYLYPDLGHERIPEVPLYFQQDYPDTKYGAYPIATHGCGITAFAMMASYMLDDEVTPPEMCAAHGRYCSNLGSSVNLFVREPSQAGMFSYYTYDPEEVKEALKNGEIVVSLQRPGYWTSMGHYIVLEEIYEDDTVLVRDSNVKNFGKLEAHKADRHAWADIIANDSTYFIIGKKQITDPGCSRCGDPDSLTQLVVQREYTCDKCEAAQQRLDTYNAWVWGEPA